MNSSKKILIIGSGSVAIIKLPQVIKLLKNNYQVKVILTNTASNHWSDATKLDVLTEDSNLTSFPDHIKWAKWADLILVVPASANTISKFYHSLADNFASSTLLAARKPIIFVPAMNTYMYQKLVDRQILDFLSKEGHMFIGPIEGKLWEGESGLGRMVEPEDIIKQIDNYFYGNKAKILLSYGASKVFLDPIRFITNTSQGYMGKLLANQLRLNGFIVNAIDIGNLTNQEFIDYALATKWDLLISPAAFADFTTKQSKEKIRKNSLANLPLEPNVDTLLTIKEKKPNSKIIAFKLDNNRENAIAKKNNLNLSGIVWNYLSSINNFETSGAIIFDDYEIPFNKISKINLAKLITAEIVKMFLPKS